MRIANIFNKTLSMKDVVNACAVHPDVLPHIKALTKTGKRGRPSGKVNGKLVVSALIKHKAQDAIAFVRELV
jgi:hypothetical protein